MLRPTSTARRFDGVGRGTSARALASAAAAARLAISNGASIIRRRRISARTMPERPVSAWWWITAPCAMAAAFNTSLTHGMGAVLGRELRAYYNAQVHDSLDTWSPTLNVNRDPRWGRNVECGQRSNSQSPDPRARPLPSLWITRD